MFIFSEDNPCTDRLVRRVINNLLSYGAAVTDLHNAGDGIATFSACVQGRYAAFAVTTRGNFVSDDVIDRLICVWRAGGMMFIISEDNIQQFHDLLFELTLSETAQNRKEMPIFVPEKLGFIMELAHLDESYDS